VIFVIEAELAGSGAESVVVLPEAHDVLWVIVPAVSGILAARQPALHDAGRLCRFAQILLEKTEYLGQPCKGGRDCMERLLAQN
jgi:hypothetical protein